jgi:hypothetical protein
MNRLAIAAALVIPAFFASAQPKAIVAVDEVEAVVTVTKVDRETRTVTFRNPQGALHTLQVPKEAQNLDKVKPGARFKMTYVESAAISLTKGGEPKAAVTEAVRLAPKGTNPGGIVVQTAVVSGVIDAIDYKNRQVAVKGPKGTVVSFRVTENVKNLEQVNVGDRINITYTQALALEMIPQPGKAKAPAKK